MVIKPLLAHIQLQLGPCPWRGPSVFFQTFWNRVSKLLGGGGGSEPFLTVQTFSVQTRGGGGGVSRGLDSVHTFVVFFFCRLPLVIFHLSHCLKVRALVWLWLRHCLIWLHKISKHGLVGLVSFHFDQGTAWFNKPWVTFKSGLEFGLCYSLGYVTVWVVSSLGYVIVWVVLQSGLCYSLGYVTVWVKLQSWIKLVWDTLQSGLCYSLGYVTVWVVSSLGYVIVWVVLQSGLCYSLG